MEKKQSNNKQFSPKERKELMDTVRYLLMVEGQSQARTAQMLNLSKKTISIWVKQDGLRDTLKKIDIKRLGDSLAAFIAYTRIHEPEVHNHLLPAYNKFLNTF